jgi:hypothetical protein
MKTFTFLFLISFFFTGILGAQTIYSWNGPNTTSTYSWDEPTYWLPNGVPGAEDIVIINCKNSNNKIRMIDKVTVTKLYMEKGTLMGDSNLTIRDSLIWTGGQIAKYSFAPSPMPQLIIPDTAGVVINGGVTVGRSLLNRGTIRWLSGNIVFKYEVRFENYGTIYDMTDDSVNITKSTGYLVEFPSYGSYIKTGKGANTIRIYYTNQGEVDVRSGKLTVQCLAGGGNIDSGSYHVGEGTSLIFVTGRKFDGPIVGEGEVVLYNSMIIRDTFDISGRTCFHSTNYKTVFEPSCTLLNLGSGMIESNGMVYFKSGETVTMDSLHLYGTDYSCNLYSEDTLVIKKYAELNGGNIGIGIGPVIIDEDAVVEITNYIRIHGVYNNYGTIHWRDGNIELEYDQYTKTVIFNNYGSFLDETVANSMIMKWTNAYSNHYFNNYGTYQKKSKFTTYITWENVFNNKESGVLGGVDTIRFSKPFTNAGTISPGDPVGTLVLVANYPSDTTTVLNIDIAGKDSVQYDHLIVSGEVTLKGTLNINLRDGYVPEAGDVFEIVRGDTLIDTFDVVNGTEIMNCRYFEVQYTDTSVLLTVYGIDPPHLTKDTLSIQQDEAVEINVLANDTTSGGDTLEVIALGTPRHGTAVMSGDSILTYTPESGFVGQDSVTYVVQRRSGCVDSSRVVLDVCSTVGVGPLPGTDQVFSVESPRPNPFETSTTFRFYLPEDAYVELSVYNILGERIFVKISERLPAGSHTYELGTAEMKRGIYIYRLSAGDHTKMGRMIKMR